MLAAVKGYYDGRQIVIDEADRKNLNRGDEVIVTILNRSDLRTLEARAARRKRIIETEAFVMETGRSAQNIDNYIRELRSDERI